MVGTNTWWLPYTKTNTDIDKVLSKIVKVSYVPFITICYN